MRLAIANQKGGVGKTTVAVIEAAAAGADGDRVLLIDADADQPAGTSRRWHRTLFELAAPGVDPLDAYRDDPERRAIALAGHRKVGFECLALDDLGPLGIRDVDGWRHVIVDCPPGRPDRIAAAVKLSDAAIIPVGPNPSEAEGVSSILELIAKTGKHLAVRVLITRVDRGRRGSATDKLIASLDRAEIPYHQTQIPLLAEIAELYPRKHPKTSIAGWVAARDLWREVTVGNLDGADLVGAR